LQVRVLPALCLCSSQIPHYQRAYGVFCLRCFDRSRPLEGSPDDRAAGIREQSVGFDALFAFLRVTTSGLGGALVLIAVGAILRYAMSWDRASVDIDTVGLILMIVGAAMIRLTLSSFSGGDNRREQCRRRTDRVGRASSTA
jgi:hypothetical protein